MAGRKETKPEQISQLPLDSIMAVARVGTMGAGKYSKYNYRGGYDWSKGFDAAIRHLVAWWEAYEHAPIPPNDPAGWGEDQSLDAESGESHLAHAAWHCLNLLHFEQYGRGTDDRPRPNVSDGGVRYSDTEGAVLPEESRRTIPEVARGIVFGPTGWVPPRRDDSST